MFRNCIGLTGILAVTLMTASASAQSLVNRKVHRVAVAPSQSGPEGTWDVHVVWTVAVEGTSVGLDMSTSISLFIGPPEVPYASAVVDVLGDTTFDCFGGCSGSCGGGYIDGVFNTMLCLHDPATCESCDCDCQFPWITSTLPGIELEPGWLLTIGLWHDAGAIPEEPGDDNFKQLEFTGDPVYWDVSLTAVDLLPHPTAPDTYDVKATWDFAIARLQEEAYLAVEAVLLVNGEQQASVASCDWIAAPPPTGCEECSGVCSQADSNCGGIDLHCIIQEGPGGFGCACQSDPQCIIIPGVILFAGDEVEVRLRPAPGALPPLPPLIEDDQLTILVPRPCPEDIDGSGSVGLADLLAVLSAWGPCDADCPEDLNGDDQVSFADLLQLLSAWGPC